MYMAEKKAIFCQTLQDYTVRPPRNLCDTHAKSEHSAGRSGEE
jgi:hypothetical protein